jgi:RNA polymerase sigma-54 factor
MAVAQRLEQRLGQTLVMTPQLQQAIKLLQLSNLELLTYVEQQVESNPLLERESEDDQAPAETETDGPFEDEAEDGEEPEGVPDAAEMAEAEVLGSDDDAPLDADYGEMFDGVEAGAAEAPAPELGIEVYGRGGRPDFDEAGGFEDRLTRPKTLREHLEGQIDCDVADATDRLICRHLIDALDDAGYFAGDCAQIAETLGCPEARVEAALALMQRCDPAGVFARSLAECLALQLRDRGRLTPEMDTLLARLDLVAGCEIERLAAMCALPPERVVELVAELRRLDPKPGLVFDSEPTQTVVPDVVVRAQNGGGWSVELNTDTLPRVLVNRRYVATVGRAARSKADRAYLSERLQTANWLVKALEQRANTILKVATELVRQQDAFLSRGVLHLRPLTLRHVADAVSMHESTISRVTTNKYMATPRGTFELKYLFSSAIPGTNGGANHSSEAIRHRIKELIEDERDDVLSDDRLVALLGASGIDIARRTVAKYRESMKIPSSVQRRRARAARF